MEPEGLLPHLQVPATCPYPEPAQSSPCPTQPNSWRSILILSTLLHLRLPSGFGNISGMHFSCIKVHQVAVCADI